MIGGFIITGVNTPKKVMIRGIGPSLGIPGALQDPYVELFDSTGTSIASNDNWATSPDKQEIIDTTIAPTNDFEAALIADLSPAAYTAIVRGKGNTTGIALVEVYDLDPWTAGTVLANISTRGLVQTGDNVMIAGFIVSPGGQNGQVLLRGIGPSLAQSVQNPLADPVLELHDGNGALIATNDDWKTDQEAQIEATGIPPTNDAEAAILESSLGAGQYTVILSGKDGTTGIGLVEVYYLSH
jgi:hypothetical protein